MVRADLGLQQVPERRRATRYLVQLPVRFRPGEGSMDGTIVDISATGARIEGAPAPEQIGGALVLQLDCFGGIGPIEFAARLVRPMEPGFAVEFTEPEPFLRALLKIALLHMEQDQERALQGSGKPR